MRKILFALLFGGSLFGASAGASWYLQQQKHGGSALAEAEDGGHGHNRSSTSSSHGHASKPASDHGKKPASSHSSGHGGHGETHGEPAELHPPTDPNELPVAVRPRPMSPEEIFRYGVSLRNREDLVHQREQAIEKELARLKLIQEDIRGEQRDIDGVLEEIRAELQNSDEMLTRVQTERSKLQEAKVDAEKKLTELEKSKSVVKAHEAENVKVMSKWFEGMSPEQAAQYLRELSNGGKLETAVQLLSNFEEREASKILAAMNDPALVIQLTESFKQLKRPEKPARR